MIGFIKKIFFKKEDKPTSISFPPLRNEIEDGHVWKVLRTNLNNADRAATFVCVSGSELTQTHSRYIAVFEVSEGVFCGFNGCERYRPKYEIQNRYEDVADVA
jgi:hypothetical protein